MVDLQQSSYLQNLKDTLSCYQLSSADSLSGPSGYPALAAELWFKENKQSPKIRFPSRSVRTPLLMSNDTSFKMSETILRGHKIACFMVGGEKRLCLPQVLTKVLLDFDITEINRVCAQLHIYCSRCSQGQLEIFKVLGILPFNTAQCGLITKSDAERLISTLFAEFNLNNQDNFVNYGGKSEGIKVYHECFGKGYGYFYPDLYTASDAACIACADCRMTLSTKKFVVHSHRGLENRTCHWGFDPENWRNYLLVPEHKEEAKQKLLEQQLETLKAKFDSQTFHKPDLNNNSSSSLKRKSAREHIDDNVKRSKEDTFRVRKARSPSISGSGIRSPIVMDLSSFKPLAQGLPLRLPSSFGMCGSKEEAFIKTYAPMLHQRRLVPGYVQCGPPAVAKDCSSAVFDGKSPNITLAPPEQQRKTAVYVMENNGCKKMEEIPFDQTSELNSSSIKTEAPRELESFPTPCRRMTPVTANNCVREKDDIFQSNSYNCSPVSSKMDSSSSDAKTLKKGSPESGHLEDVQEEPQNLSRNHLQNTDKHKAPRESDDQSRNTRKHALIEDSAVRVKLSAKLMAKFSRELLEAASSNRSNAVDLTSEAVQQNVSRPTKAIATSTLPQISEKIINSIPDVSSPVKETSSYLSLPSIAHDTTLRHDKKNSTINKSHPNLPHIDNEEGRIALLEGRSEGVTSSPHSLASTYASSVPPCYGKPVPESTPHATDGGYPVVSKLDDDVFKWVFPSSSYLISSSGTVEVEKFQALLNGVGDNMLKLKLLDEVVKTTARHEKSLQKQRHIQCEIEEELNLVKSSLRQCLKCAATNERDHGEEVNRMRQDHLARVRRFNHYFTELERELTGLPNNP